MRRLRTRNAPATRRQPAGKDNFAPAEDLHNKSPALVALRKNQKIHNSNNDNATGFASGLAIVPIAAIEAVGTLWTLRTLLV